MSENHRRTVVIGLGNPIMGDDGMGLAALARLGELWELPSSVELVDGGTWGMNLLPVIEDAGRVVLLDAIDTRAAPGTRATLERAHLPRHLQLKISPHQVDFQDVLALAELRGTLPAHTVALGLQPERVEMGVGLSPLVAQALDGLVAATVELLETWGHRCTPRTEPAVHA